MADHCCQREVDVRSLQDGQRRILRTVFAINVFTFLLMLAAALYSHSSSLLSGGLDNFGDAVTYALSLAVVSASHLSKRRVALFKGLLIFAAALAVAAQIGWRLLRPTVPLFDAMGAAALLCLFLRSAWRVLSAAWQSYPETACTDFCCRPARNGLTHERHHEDRARQPTS